MTTRIEIELARYDELLYKEKHLEIILQALGNLSGYSNIDEFKRFLGIEGEEKRKEV